MLNLLHYDPFKTDHFNPFERFGEGLSACLGCPDNGKLVEEDEARLDYLARYLIPDSRSEAERFLHKLDPAGLFTFQTFDDDKERKDKKLTCILNGTLDQHWNTLCNLNRKGAGVYVTVNETDGKGREKKNITRVRAPFVDLDGASLEPVVQSKQEPHIIVESSPGKFHCYWLVEGVALEQFEGMQKALAARFGGDPKVCDLPRVLRVPGFYHRKGEPYRSHIVRLRHSAPAYEVADFEVKASGQHFEDYGDGYKPPIDIPAALAAMTFEAKGKESVHYTQLSVTASLLSQGKKIEDVVETMLAETMERIGESLRWDEEKERETIWGMCESWLEEHPQQPKESGEEGEAMLLATEPHDFPAEETLAPYDWLLGRHLARGEVAGTAATGGTGKNSKSVIEALAMASGKQLTFDTVPSKPLRVVLINLEDSRNTMDKRIAAAMKHYKLTKEDIGDRLFVLAKGEIKFKIARETRGEVKRNQKAIDALTKLMIEKKGDVLSIDSLIRSHSVNENANGPMEQVIECYEEIAQRANCGVHLWHHTRKGGSKSSDGETTVESARGAQAFIDACRSVRILETMSKADARKLGADEKNYRRHFRVFSGKRNFAPHIEDSNWYYIVSVELNNAPPGSLLDGDSIGVVKTWVASEAQEAAALSPEKIAEIKKAVDEGVWRESTQAGMWVGKAIGPIVDLDPDDDKDELVRLIKKLVKDKKLKTIPDRTDNRKPCLNVVSGDHTAKIIKPKAWRREKAAIEVPVKCEFEGCDKTFRPKRKDARFCSDLCRKKARRDED